MDFDRAHTTIIVGAQQRTKNGGVKYTYSAHIQARAHTHTHITAFTPEQAFAHTRGATAADDFPGTRNVYVQFKENAQRSNIQRERERERERERGGEERNIEWGGGTCLDAFMLL